MTKEHSSRFTKYWINTQNRKGKYVFLSVSLPFWRGARWTAKFMKFNFLKVLHKLTFIGIDYYSRFTITALDALNVCPEYNKFE